MQQRVSHNERPEDLASGGRILNPSVLPNHLRRVVAIRAVLQRLGTLLGKLRQAVQTVLADEQAQDVAAGGCDFLVTPQLDRWLEVRQAELRGQVAVNRAGLAVLNQCPERE